MALSRVLPPAPEASTGGTTAVQAIQSDRNRTTPLQKLVMTTIVNGDVRALRDIHENMATNKAEAALVAWTKKFHSDYRQMPSAALFESVHNLVLKGEDQSTQWLLNRAAAAGILGRLGELTAKAGEMFKNASTAEDMLSQVQSMLLAGSQMLPIENITRLQDAAEMVLRSYEETDKGLGPAPITFGMPSLDAINGGMMTDDLSALVAYTNVGKTHYLLSMALHAWRQGHDVLFVSNEMDTLPVARRLFSQMTRLNPDFIRRATLSNFGLDTLRTTLRFKGGEANFDFMAGSFGLRVGALRRAIESRRPKAVYTDGMYLMEPEEGKYRQQREVLHQLAGELKRCCKDYQTPNMGTLQFNRDHSKAEKGDKKKGEKTEKAFKRRQPNLHDMFGSAAWEQNASLIIGMAAGDEPYADMRRRFWDLKRRESQVTPSWECRFEMGPVDLSEIADVDEAKLEVDTDHAWGRDVQRVEF